jgi:branched-subunit amino acid ABC-type transport system permease component
VSVFVESIGFGLVTSAVLAVASVGFTLQFAVTNVLNLAYGGVMIVSAYAAYAVNQHGVSVWISALAGIAAGALVSVILNNLIYTPGRPTCPTPRVRGRRSRRSGST